MSGNDEQSAECPLCMEPLEMDDINFFPCTCGYQICRFCWHRIRTDENGLCPACRKQYPEDPADFKPLTQDELQRIKNEKRQKDLQRKQKISENRKHLGNVRVVQKNLVFVVGLSQRLADPEVLKRHEYFGKFGKTHKVVINHSTSYAGSQGPSASAYVTYYRVEDALKAIQAVNNIHVDGRTLKASLGTTKYCSHFLKGQPCPKSDCMYLHELGDDAASFTKEEMQQGKHQEYEKKLHEQLFNSLRKQAASPTPCNQSAPTDSKSTAHTNASNGSGGSSTRDTWPSLQSGSHNKGGGGSCSGRSSKAQNKESGHNQHRSTTRNRNGSGEDFKRSKEKAPSELNARSHALNSSQSSSSPPPPPLNSLETVRMPGGRSHSPQMVVGSPGSSRTPSSPLVPAAMSRGNTPPSSSTPSSICSVSSVPSVGGQGFSQTSSGADSPAHSLIALESSSASSSLSSSSTDIPPYFGSRNGYPPPEGNSIPQASVTSLDWMSSSPTDDSSLMGADVAHSNTDWQAAFGFGSSQPKDDDLGFDPWDESSKALADLIEKETLGNDRESSPRESFAPSQHLHSSHQPSFNRNTMTSVYNHVGHSQAMHIPPYHLHHSHPLPHPSHMPPPLATSQQPPHPPAPAKRLGAPPGFGPSQMPNSNPVNRSQSTAGPPHHIHQQMINGPTYNFGDSLLANLSKTNHIKDMQGNHSKNHRDMYSMKEWQDNLRALFPNINITFGNQNNCTSQPPQPTPQKAWNVPHVASEISWVVQDPAVVSAGSVTDVRPDSPPPPHWMKSLQQLTEVDYGPTAFNNHRVPIVNQLPYRHPQWPTSSQIPPPGFSSHLRNPVKPTEPQKIMDNF